MHTKSYRRRTPVIRIVNAFLAGVMLLFPFPGLAGALDPPIAAPLPMGPQVIHGPVDITTQGANMTVHQHGPAAIVNWDYFGIAQGHGVHFQQPSSSAAILNRVLGLDPSVINGVLEATGIVYLVNPQGIVFGRNATINVNALIASTLNITDPNFLAGKQIFSGDSTAPTA